MVVGCHVLRSVHFLLLLLLLPGRPVLLLLEPCFRKISDMNEETNSPSHRGIDPRCMGQWWWVGGRRGVGWNDFQIKRKIKGSLVKFRNSWRVHRVPGFRISGGEAKR